LIDYDLSVTITSDHSFYPACEHIARY